VTTTTTLKAIGFKAGSIDSSVSSATYYDLASGSGTGFRQLLQRRELQHPGPHARRPHINFDWGNNSRPQACRSTSGRPLDGKVQANFSETYTSIRHRDGVRSGQRRPPRQQVDRQGATEWSGAIALVAGQQAES